MAARLETKWCHICEKFTYHERTADGLRCQSHDWRSIVEYKKEQRRLAKKRRSNGST